MDWINETKLQTADAPAHWLSEKHNGVVLQKRQSYSVSISGVTRQENVGVILNHTLIQQKMTAIVNILRIEFNTWKRK